LPDGDIHKMLRALVAGRAANAPLFTRNGKAVRDFRDEWARQTEGMGGGSGGCITIHHLRRSAITAMSEKGITAAQAGTHLAPDLFAPYITYITRNLTERRKTAKLIES
jgi:hypothetical protein